LRGLRAATAVSLSKNSTEFLRAPKSVATQNNITNSMVFRFKIFSALLVVAALAWGAYIFSPALHSFFLSDDFDILASVHNTPFSLRYFSTNMLGGTAGSVYRPLVRLSFLVNDRLGGLDPRGYFAANIVLHLINSVLVALLALMLFKNKKNYVAAYFAGLVFLVLGNHAEAVQWLASRGDLLSTFFVLLTLILYIQFRSYSRGCTRRYSAAAGAFISFCFALLSKEMAIVVPLLIIAYDFVCEERPLMRRVWLLWVVSLAPLVGYLWMRAASTGVLWNYYNASGAHMNFVNMGRTFVQIIISHFASGSVRMFLFSTVDHHRLLAYGGGMALAALVVASIYMSKISPTYKRVLGFFTLFFIIGTLPVLSLKLNSWTDEGERFAYLPSVGFALLVGAACGMYIQYQAKTQWIQWKLFAVVLLLAWFVANQSLTMRMKSIVWQNAGAASRTVLEDMHTFTLAPRGALVIMGLPETIQGAQVYRNGFFSALKLWYPDYAPNILPLKFAYEPWCGYYCARVTSENLLDLKWYPSAQGFIAQGGIQGPMFYGEKFASSPDVVVDIVNYNDRFHAGAPVQITFTSAFLAQRAQAPMMFAAFSGGHLQEVKLGE